MDTYVKVFQSILDSTVWQEDLPTKVVWITMLAMKDRRGYVGASVPGLAKRAGVTIKECELALSRFTSPDEYSRTKAFEGRRIQETEGGWTVLNHETYRSKMSPEDRREYQRIKQAEYRKRKKDFKEQAHKDGASEAVVDGLVEAEAREEDVNREYPKSGFRRVGDAGRV